MTATDGSLLMLPLPLSFSTARINEYTAKLLGKDRIVVWGGGTREKKEKEIRALSIRSCRMIAASTSDRSFVQPIFYRCLFVSLSHSVFRYRFLSHALSSFLVLSLHSSSLFFLSSRHDDVLCAPSPSPSAAGTGKSKATIATQSTAL